MTGTPIPLPLDRVLRLVAAEVGALAGLAARAGDALALALGGAAPPSLLRDAQGLDELGQRIVGLRAYLDDLAAAAPGGVVIDVSAGVAALSLAAQATRLSGRVGEAAEGGAVELF